MERKLCADCGETSLATDPRCWACGSPRFSADDARLAGEPTICLGNARETTVAFQRQRSLPMPQLYVLCAAACALFTSVLGYWIGRASAPADPPAQTAAAQPVAPPQALPSPPTGLAFPQPAARANAPYYDPAIVTVRQKSGSSDGGAAAKAARALVAGAAAPYASPTGPVVLQNPNLRARQRPQVISEDLGSAGPGALSQAGAENPIQVAPQPSPDLAVVMLRNNASSTVEVEIDGDEDWTVTVAPGSSVPVPLTPGSYQLHAAGAGAHSKRSSMSLGANRRYSLVIDRRQENGKDALVLMEPAVDGVGG